MKYYAGGEPFYSPKIFFKRKNFKLAHYIISRFRDQYKYFYFTGGGIHSLYQIIKNINFEPNGFCLLPSYLCPTLLKPFDLLGIKYDFYCINENFEIDHYCLEKKADSNCKAILFINYFGFPISFENEKLLLKLQNTGIVLIQDLVHGFFSELNLIGNFCFNSFRKFLPVDCSIILSKSQINFEKGFINYKYHIFKNLGRLLRYISFFSNFDFSVIYLYFFSISEKNYYKYPTRFSLLAKIILERSQINSLSIRKHQFKKYLDELFEVALIKSIPDGVIPLGFPIILNDNINKRKLLISENVYCPIHWILPNIIMSNNNFVQSSFLSRHILTIPFNTDFKPDLLTEKVKKIINTENQ